MNADHDAPILLAKRFAGIEAEEANMTSVDRLGFHLRLKTQDGMRGARIAFLQEVRNPAQTREVFVEIVEQARQGSTASTSGETCTDRCPAFIPIIAAVDWASAVLKLPQYRPATLLCHSLPINIESIAFHTQSILI